MIRFEFRDANESDPTELPGRRASDARYELAVEALLALDRQLGFALQYNCNKFTRTIELDDDDCVVTVAPIVLDTVTRKV